MNEQFKLAIGVTKHKFVISINGQEVMKFPINDSSFFGKSLNFGCTSSDELSLTIEGVDTFVMGVNGKEFGRESANIRDVLVRKTFISNNSNLDIALRH